MRIAFVHPFFARFRMVQSSIKSLFARGARRFHRRGGRVVGRVVDGVRSAAANVRLDGFAALESRAMLAADDIGANLLVTPSRFLYQCS